MYRVHSLVFPLILLIIIAIPAQFEENPCLHRTLPVTLIDARGIPARDLQATDLQPESKAGPVKILSLAPDERPHRVVILLDGSASLASIWHKVQFLPLTLAKTNLSNTTMALVVFDDKVRETLDFSTPQNKIAERIVQVGAAGPKSRTALYDSILYALQLLERPSSADSLYIATDGADTASHAKFNDIVPRISSSGVRFSVSFVFAELGNRSREPWEYVGPENLTALARMTGGESNAPYPPQGFLKKPEDTEQIAQQMHKFFLRMTQNYQLDVELSSPLKKASKWELRLSEEGRHRWGNAQLNYPGELAACQP
jgi:VWA domain-containing protein